MCNEEHSPFFFNGDERHGTTATDLWKRMSAPCVIAGMGKRTVFFYALRYAWVTFVVSLVVGLIGLALGGRLEHLLASAVTGQFSTAIIKLMTYSAWVILGMSISTMSLRWFRPLWWLSGHVAKVTFDYWSGALGIVGGFAVCLCIEGGWVGALRGTWLILIVVLGQLLMYFPVRVLYRKTAVKFLAVHCRPAFLGAALAALGVVGFHHETWPEVFPAPPQQQHAARPEPSTAGTESGISTAAR